MVLALKETGHLSGGKLDSHLLDLSDQSKSVVGLTLTPLYLTETILKYYTANVGFSVI